ncbi:uncharacterized protein PHACADRAFT_256669 [Phanerochaete carnosa HHB-10118-sp]|uniref:Protein kinase domain-containing protein n=1 Tax=Phanerochaete carnosa (strain HHB-10118-sp) TaxID=650164 RepID=K5WZ75_PHACS|nr:uncharacterized protein PHACADRAFT_256669 [Phanerochaete carnosa HHB-10118-sp]EKM55787.1 hypothetical protein PHACADRAFT_256669 [Phanerochaete carnosa HHB-10118-sp]
MSGLPGVPAVSLAVQCVQDKLKNTKYRQRTCVIFVEGMSSTSGKDRDLPPPVNECVVLLEEIVTELDSFSRYSRLKLILKDEDIKDQLKNLEKKLQAEIESFNMRTGAKSAAIKTMQALHQAAEMTEDLQSLKFLVQEMTDPQKGKQRSSGESQELLNRGHQAVELLTEASLLPDSELNVDGVGMTRSQLNQLYNDVVGAVNQLWLQTGMRPQEIKLRSALHIPKNYRGDRSPVLANQWATIYIGSYLDRKVAVKEFRSFANNAEKAKKHFVNGVKTWSFLKHDHVHTIIGMDDTVLSYIALVSIWEENGDIMKYTKENPGVDLYHLLAGAADGMAYLHGKNVIHGNLKGANILVSSNGEALITDFGLAKVLLDAAKDCNLSAQTVTRGPVPRWSAPELFMARPPDIKSDVWSFGMVMLEVSTGDVPFPKMRRDVQIIHAISNRGERPERPENNDWVTEDIWTVMQSCWQTDPDDRTDLTEVQAALEQAEQVRQDRPREPAKTSAIMRSVLGLEANRDYGDGLVPVEL